MTNKHIEALEKIKEIPKPCTPHCVDCQMGQDVDDECYPNIIRNIATQALSTPQECDVTKCSYARVCQNKDKDGNVQIECKHRQVDIRNTTKIDIGTKMCKDNPNCYYKQLQTAKEEKEKLNKLHAFLHNKFNWSKEDVWIRNYLSSYIFNEEMVSDGKEYISPIKQISDLTQQNKRLREALKAISKAHSETVPRIMKYAQQALKGLNNENTTD